MVRILGFHSCGPGSIPGQGEILQAVRPKKKDEETGMERLKFASPHKASKKGKRVLPLAAWLNSVP